MDRERMTTHGGVPSGGQIIPFDGKPRSGMSPRGLMVAGCLWCAVGGSLGLVAGPLGALFVSFGASLLSRTHGTGGIGTAVAVSLAATLVSSFIDGTSPYEMVVCMGSALVVGCLAGTARLTPNVACLVTLGAAVSLLGIDALQAWLAGTDIVTAMTAPVHEVLAEVESEVASSVDVTTQLQLLERVYDVLWPCVYALVALADVACASYGARAALRRLGASGTIRPFREFDLPLWAGYCLLAGIVGLVLSISVASQSSVVLMASANVLVFVRFGLGVAGLAVLAWFLDQHHVAGFLRVLAYLLAVALDVQFFVMAIVGLIDVWANFRHLNRGGGAPQRES